MQLTDAPGKIVMPFANAGDKNTIPVTTSTPGAASLTAGFPPETGIPVPSGGTPPSRLDFNGMGFEMSALDRWFSAGASFPFDAAFATAVGGYPLGAKVLRADGLGYWRSTINNNSNNPDTVGTGWTPDGLRATSSVYASAQQTLVTGSSKVLFDTVEYDAHSLWNAANKRFVAPYAGLYRISGAVMLAAPDGQLLATQIWKQGALAKQCFQAPQVADGLNLTLPFDAVISLAATEYAEIYMSVSQSNVLAGQVGSNQAYVYAQCEYLGVS